LHSGHHAITSSIPFFLLAHVVAEVAQVDPFTIIIFPNSGNRVYYHWRVDPASAIIAELVHVAPAKTVKFHFFHWLVDRAIIYKSFVGNKKINGMSD